MKKIPTLFLSEYANGRRTKVIPLVRVGFEWVLKGAGIATIKADGSACAIIGGEFYRRYDAKYGKQIPEGAIPCQEQPDAVTGHFPCWVKCRREAPEDKWYWTAYDAYIAARGDIRDGTYEAVGKHFQTNPYGLDADILLPHGEAVVEVVRTFEGIRDYLAANNIEGLVFWKDGEPQCKIRRRDFGFPWPDTGTPAKFCLSGGES